MDKQPQLSRHDLLIIFAYGGAILATIVLFYLIGILRNGISLPAIDAHHIEIAILIPQTGAQAALGKNIEQVAKKSLDFYRKNNPNKNWDITLTTYDAGNNAHSAALAAQLAAQNMATVAIVGPINARQVIAAAVITQDKQIAIISPASTASVLDLTKFRNVYRIPAPDQYQGDAIVEYLSAQRKKNVFLIGEPGKYSDLILDRFKQAAKDRIKISGTAALNTGVPPDLAQNLSSSKTDVIVFIGSSKYFSEIMNIAKTASASTPIIGVDAINEDKIARKLTGTEQVFFTSSILNKGDGTSQLPEDYKKTLGNLAGQPYTYETSQAIWAILASLDQAGQNSSARIEIQQTLNSILLPGESGGRITFNGRQMQPAYVYVYSLRSSPGSPIHRFSIP